MVLPSLPEAERLKRDAQKGKPRDLHIFFGPLESLFPKHSTNSPRRAKLPTVAPL